MRHTWGELVVGRLALMDTVDEIAMLIGQLIHGKGEKGAEGT